MTYTINGKEYTEFDINKRCAELMGIKVEYPMFNEVPYHRWFDSDGDNLKVLDLCNNPADTWPIIDKCWDELMDYTNDKGLKPISDEDIFWTRWESLINRHKCTKLVAACICYIELNK
jgi:hypothetical protein